MDIMRVIAGSRRGNAGAVLSLLCLASAAPAQVTLRVTFNDPENTLAPLSASIASNLHGAAALWSERLKGNTELWIEVLPDSSVSNLSCRSFTWSYLDTIDGGIDIFETGASTHIRNGYPAASFDPDIVLKINPTFAVNDLWFDPAPFSRTAPIDSARFDAVSQFARGLGRAFAFDGWINGNDGTYSGNARSTFDQLIVFDGTNFSFIGDNAVAAYRAPVPVTFGAPFLVGNEPPRPGTDLLNDVMSGRPLARGIRYQVSALDFAILQDARVPVIIPCPWDLTHDGFIDDHDFAVFTQAYDLYDCGESSMPSACPSDFNKDSVVDDFDYVIFIQGYEQFICL
ncbi:MAG: hypothetical protein KF691_15740 [Phycisphaeraceae bacterium]|nr:hypothetical protein [Phycisphaeraceae bacterium]